MDDLSSGPTAAGSSRAGRSAGVGRLGAEQQVGGFRCDFVRLGRLAQGQRRADVGADGGVLAVDGADRGLHGAAHLVQAYCGQHGGRRAGAEGDAAGAHDGLLGAEEVLLVADDAARAQGHSVVHNVSAKQTYD